MMSKRIAMAGSEVTVTDGRLADLILVYAMRLGQAHSADVVTFPVAHASGPAEASFLLGPSSQISLSANRDLPLDAVELPGLEAALVDLQRRIDSLPSPGNRAAAGGQVLVEEAGANGTFPDFDLYGAY